MCHPPYTRGAYQPTATNQEENIAQALRSDDAEEQGTSTGRRQEATAKHGNVGIVIWRNEGKNGAFYSASVPTISYKDEGGEFKEGKNFGRHDLLDLAEAGREAAMRIRDLQKSRRQSR